MDERYFWLGFSVFSGIGPIKFKLLYQHFGSAKKAWETSVADLLKIGLGEKTTSEFDDFRNNFSINDYAQELKEKGVSFLILSDSEYPELLKTIQKPPFVLYLKASHLNDIYHLSSIAIVGTRKITQYGREVTEFLTNDLVNSGFTIVSGLALGVDTIAHKTAIENNGKTIVVLGSGVDCCFPRENQYLYDQILESEGAIVSELPLGHGPTMGSFPARNRIIAGLSLGVLVTEGAEDSGSLITAEYALQEKRKVFAVPGPITSNLSKGPYRLISRGAKLVTSAQDIIDELEVNNVSNPPSSRLRRARGETKEEKMILDLLHNEVLHFDEIVRKTGIDSAKVGVVLSMMEIKGLIKSSGGSFSITS